MHGQYDVAGSQQVSLLVDIRTLLLMSGVPVDGDLGLVVQQSLSVPCLVLLGLVVDLRLTGEGRSAEVGTAEGMRTV